MVRSANNHQILLYKNQADKTDLKEILVMDWSKIGAIDTEAIATVCQSPVNCP